jgi:hypothetical protein
MCTHCQLAVPGGAYATCHACAIALRAEVRDGLRAIGEHLGEWADFERWLAGED